ncbi:hypothetical protein GCM10011428_36540 [Streptomyces violaceus]
MKPIAEPFLDGMSGVTTLLATYAGNSFFAVFPDVVPSRDPLSDPPHAASSGIPPATAAVATAVEARKDLRLGPEEAEAAFGVIASTLHGTPGHPAEGRRLRCLEWNWLSRSDTPTSDEECAPAGGGLHSRSASMLLRD